MIEGFHYLFHPVMQRLFAFLDEGELGELRHVDALIAMPEPDDGDPRWSFDLAGGALVGTGNDTRTERLGTRSSYIYQLEAFIQALRGGAPMPTGPDDAVATALLIDRCYRAAGLPLRPRKTLTPTERRI